MRASERIRHTGCTRINLNSIRPQAGKNSQLLDRVREDFTELINAEPLYVIVQSRNYDLKCEGFKTKHSL